MLLSKRPLSEHCKNWRKIEQTMFVRVCELQTPKPEHGYNIETGRFLASKFVH